MKRAISVIAILLFVIIHMGFADPITPSLAQKMQLADAKSKLPVIVEFQTPFSVKSILEKHRIRGDRKSRTEQVVSLLKQKAQEAHHLILQFCTRSDMSNEVEGVKSFWLTNMVALKATPAALRKIARLPDVKRMILDEEKVFLPPIPNVKNAAKEGPWGVAYIGADQYASCSSNIVVAVIDTGVDYNHPAFDGHVDTVNDFDFYNDDDDAYDDHYHGTHCAGTVAGFFDDAGQRIGVAPGATILPIKVLSAYGSGSWENVASGVEHAFAKNANIASMSLGGGYTIDPQSALAQAIQNCIANDVVMVIAAGNSGSSAETINAPGCMEEVITVGAIDSAGNIASFSSRGPTRETGYEKPDIVAPGVSVKSAAPNNSYKTISGTSMATPHVAGISALILDNNTFPEGEAHDAVKNRLMTYVKADSTVDPNVYGSGTVWAPGAVVGSKSSQSALKIKIRPLGKVQVASQPIGRTSAATREDIDIDISTIINIAKQIWDFVEENQPVVNIQYDFATAVPKGTEDCWSQLANWKGPNAIDYMLEAENLYGMTVVRFKYRVMWTWGGDYQGKGRYLTNVTAVPVEVYVAWGYTFESKVQIPQVYNVGTTENPIAGMQMVVSWKIHTIVTHAEGAGTYEVRGTGEFADLGK